MQQVNKLSTSPNVALIALGANVPSPVGAPEDTLRCAMSRIEAEIGPITGKSSLYVTPCFPAGNGPDFVNAVITVHTSELPRKVMDLLHIIEADFGRKRVLRWGQRSLDLDILGLGATVCPDFATFATWRHLPPDQQQKASPDQLILPHPRLQDRAFVLVPLCEFAPDWVHPVTGQTATQMRDALPVSDLAGVVRLPDTNTQELNE